MIADGSTSIGLAVSTVGRPELLELLRSAAAGTTPPAAVAIANQSGRPLQLALDDLPFPVRVVESSGGVGRGRNDALAALPFPCDVVGFPNDDSSYPSDLLTAVGRAFAADRTTAGIACRLQEPAGVRFALPPPGTPLTRRTVWRAIEPAVFVSTGALRAAGGFRTDLGAGAGTPWGSGEGTELLLRLLAAGHVVRARPDLAVLGRGERRTLDDDELVDKHRSYARGTGRVYRLHGYPLSDRVRILLGPLARPTSHAPELGLSLRLAAARTTGRLEGLTGRATTPGPAFGRRLQPWP